MKAMNGSKLADFEMQSKLGQGSFGVVYRVKRKGKRNLNLRITYINE